VLTFLPPSAPFVVPIRMALDAVPLWQAAVAVGLTVAAAIATVRLAGRLYSAALLAGDKLTWRQVWHAEPIR
jgi:ABC-2 type transport system permease protein